jgi:hypothetical protein
MATRILFSFVWANSTSLLLLVLLEIQENHGGTLRETRLMWWKVQLLLSIANTMILVPASICLNVALGSPLDLVRANSHLWALVGTASFCLLMHQIGSFFPEHFHIGKENDIETSYS